MKTRLFAAEFFDKLLAKTGGLYIIIVIAAAQLLAFVGAIIGTYSISLNADFTKEQIQATSWATPFFILLGNLILLWISWWLTPTARKRLDEWSKGILRANPKEELIAWRQITALTWLYGAIAVVVACAVDILPTAIYFYEIGITTFDQLIYSLMGGLVSVIGVVILATLIIDRFLLPARLALVPKEFESQLTGRAGALLMSKFQILNLALIAIAVLLIGPIGYHQTYLVLYTEIGSQPILRNLQTQSITVSLLALGLGFLLSYFITRSISDPIRMLIDTFKKVEQGDLSQRAPLLATDELGEVTIHFNRMVTRLEELQGTLEKQVEERTRQLKATNEVGKVASSILDPEELIKKVVNLITDQFGYYYSAIYMIDAGEKWAELHEATGEAGNVLKQNHHRLELNGKSMVSNAIQGRKPIIAQVASEEAQRFANPLLPYTKSEIALPLMIGDRILGALDVQSTKEADFRTQDVETLQNMASQVAIAIENARLFQDAQKNLKEMRAIQQQYLQDAWSNISVPQSELEYKIGDSESEDINTLQIPLTLREYNLGQISIEGKQSWTQEERNLVEAVATQAAIALENARLVNESRQIASRERMIAEINNKIWASATIEGILQTALRELGRRLDASQAAIELEVDNNP